MNERWYAALADHLGGEDKLRQRLEDMLEDLIDILPDSVCAEVSRELQEERRRQDAEAEANRRFAVFEVTEQGGTGRFLLDSELDTLRAAKLVRGYLRGEYAPANRFQDVKKDRLEITARQFDAYIRERMDGGRRVTGAFKLDLDAGTFATMDSGPAGQDCWRRYQLKDVLSAVFQAYRREWQDRDARLDLFQARLTGRELTPARDLDVGRITFGDEMIEMDGRLNFYVEVGFDPDRAFGLHVCTGDNDDWINVYANYDTRRSRVCDELEIDLCRSDGTERGYIYPLTAAQRKTLFKKMDAFCQEATGLPLTEYSAQVREQGQGDGPAMSGGPVVG